MNRIESIDALEALYGEVSTPARVKVTRTITPYYAEWIEASPFCALASVGPEGLDCSPRGDVGAVVRIVDPTRLAMPDWRGNNRVDTLRNIVRDPRVSLMFLIPGSPTVMRVNGRAFITADEAETSKYEMKKQRPRAVIFVDVDEVYFQCAKSVNRSKLWADGHVDPATLPSVGAMLEAVSTEIDAATYDEQAPRRHAETMW
ncbi:MSMEG_1061 family FMN-dependent PPOX-type flavoprotein [Acuticoccus sp. I52.16.1]|uniref:MSMEG_1061 family FMN-dependent PPOX-type flavoprotein n=1 Tax=Acuticoccus sp. I52.16.1 TaxID=2928472 RepID=UPI001FD1159F|nr:MSMEG_1061 family FMN-dependent PPOX-type flavoprotein [Acuticoccus sp. I52.16.1]UOM32790.1 pyridoxamine 5'-phosphate oxidase family protein [Acuticoccus sp. I52.16.1]